MEHYLPYIALAMLLYCFYSARISSFGITMPMLFLGLGIVVGQLGAELSLDSATVFHDLAEITLALLLFADATQLRRSALERIGQRTARMLLVGLPLAILFGAILNRFLLPDWPLWEVCLLAALLAPTDAALGQSIQSNPGIPKPFRDAMNAESGLNDGLALPFVLFFAGLASGESEGVGEGTLLTLVATQIGIGALVGLVGGALAGKLRDHALERGLMDHGLVQVSTLVLIGFVFFAAEHAGGNAFVAVFTAGLAFTNAAKTHIHSAREFLEGDGQFLAMLSFFFIGALFVPEALEHITLAGLAVIVTSILLVRPAAIWMSLLGTNTTVNERLFYGWFGPRGLATALFAIFVVMDFHGLGQAHGILAIAMTAVLISAVLHGISAKYATQIFGFDQKEKAETPSTAGTDSPEPKT